MSDTGPRRIRIRQRAYTGDTRTISDHVTYVVPFEESAWVFSVAFPDPRDADRWLPELDELTSRVQVQAAA